MSLVLYENPLSGNAYKCKLLLSMLGLPYATQPVNLAAGEGQRPEFLAINPMGQVPALVDGDEQLRDSQAILVYLAMRYGDGRWMPTDPAGISKTFAWLSLAANELANGPALLRVAKLFNRAVDTERATMLASRACGLLEHTLKQQAWLMPGEHPSIADLACFPYIALAGEGGFSIEPWPHVVAWCQRVRGLPGFVGMKGIPE